MAVSVGTSPESLRESLTFSWTSFSSLGGRSRWMQESDLGSDKARWEGEPKVLAGEIKQRYPASIAACQLPRTKRALGWWSETGD